MNEFYLASMDIVIFIPPRKCKVLEKVIYSESEKVLQVSIDTPIFDEAFDVIRPVTELLLSFCDASQSIEEIGARQIMVNIIIPMDYRRSLPRAPLRIGIGTLHANWDEAIRSSPIEKDEVIRHTEKFVPAKIEFRGEQTGVMENQFKVQLRQILQQNNSVERAYLAKVSYNQEPGVSVAICIRNERGYDGQLEQAVSNCFFDTFCPDQHLDILFIQDDQERELRMVCNPFYEI